MCQYCFRGRLGVSFTDERLSQHGMNLPSDCHIHPNASYKAKNDVHALSITSGITASKFFIGEIQQATHETRPRKDCIW